MPARDVRLPAGKLDLAFVLAARTVLREQCRHQLRVALHSCAAVDRVMHETDAVRREYRSHSTHDRLDQPGIGRITRDGELVDVARESDQVTVTEVDTQEIRVVIRGKLCRIQTRGRPHDAANDAVRDGRTA